MSSRSLNKVLIIGNLTRDPELRYTPQGTAVCSFGLATNRSWTTESNEKREEVEFHRVVAWNKLAELCAQLLFKGRKVYIEGRLSTRSWTAQDGTQRQTTEIVSEEMIILDNRTQEGEVRPAYGAPVGVSDQSTSAAPPIMPTATPVAPVVPAIADDIAVAPSSLPTSDDLSIDDIPDDLGVSEPSAEKPVEEKPVVKKAKAEAKPETEDKKTDGDIPF